MQVRLLRLAGCFLAAFAVLCGRLFFITVVPDGISPGRPPGRWQDQIRARAELEHLAVVQTDDGRGRIRFRNGAPWSGVRWPAVIPTGAVQLRVSSHSERSRSPLWDPLLGEVGLPDRWPASDRAVPEQGRSGLAYTFDAVLRSRRPGYVGWLKHETSASAAGSAPVWQMPAQPGWDVVTTVDPAWQQTARLALAAARVPRGAVVVLDVRTRDILAMASRDAADPRRVVAVEPQTPGSVFKLVTMAAVLESFRLRPDSLFYCSGRLAIPGVHMNCWRHHGAIRLVDALAESCDVAFAEAGLAAGRAGLDWMSRRLHLTEWPLQSYRDRPVLAECQAGRVFFPAAADPGYLANTAIGQQDVRISPLCAANLAATVASGGWYMEPRLVDGLWRAGAVQVRLPPSHRDRACSPWTAHVLGEGMRLAVTSPAGTAHYLAGAKVAVAAKTGTAELGASGQVNGWLIGYFPYGHPQIAFCVFAAHLPSAQAHRAVARMATALVKTAESAGWVQAP